MRSAHGGVDWRRAVGSAICLSGSDTDNRLMRKPEMTRFVANSRTADLAQIMHEARALRARTIRSGARAAIAWLRGQISQQPKTGIA